MVNVSLILLLYTAYDTVEDMQPNDHPSVERLAQLQQFIIELGKVTRVLGQFGNTGRPENDLDHSFGIALLCWYLAPKIAPELSIEKILKYALAHDTIEVHAGDTFVFAKKKVLASKSDREDAAIEKLYEDWPDFPEMADYARGYKNKIDEEAKFVKAVDKIAPLLVIETGDGAAYWEHHKITLEKIRENKLTIRVSDHVAPYYDRAMTWLEERGTMHSPGKA